MAGILKRMMARPARTPLPPPPTPPAAFADRWYAADGLRLYARDYAASDGEARVPVVCLHGLTRNSRDFEDLAPWIAGHGRRVLALDIRGRGRSARDPEPMRYNPVVYASDVVALLQRLGVSRAVFIGTSMGGLITMALAGSRPDLIEASVINDVGVRISPAGLTRITAAVSAAHHHVGSWEEAAAFARGGNGAAFPHYTEEDWLAFARRLFEPDGHGKLKLSYDPAIAEPITAAAASGLPAPDLSPWFLALTSGRPCLLIRGQLSDVLDQGTVDEMRLLAPATAVVEVKGVGHAPTLSEPAALHAIGALLDAVG